MLIGRYSSHFIVLATLGIEIIVDEKEIKRQRSVKNSKIIENIVGAFSHVTYCYFSIPYHL
jgi:hypothetical protein